MGTDEMGQPLADIANPPLTDPNSEEFEWYGWVESKLAELQNSMSGAHAGVEANTNLVNAFLSNVNERIEGALSDYRGAIAHEFARTNETVEKTRKGFHEQLQVTSDQIQDQMHQQMLNFCNSQSMENGAFWQSVVASCNASLAEASQKHFEATERSVTAFMKESLANVNLNLDAKVSANNAMFKEWVGKQILAYDKNVCTRMSRIEAVQTALHTQFSGIQQMQKELADRFDRKQNSNEQNFMLCLSSLQQLSTKVNPEKDSATLGEIRAELGKLQTEALERARVEGNLQAKVRGLEKSVSHFQTRAAPALVPPVNIHVPPPQLHTPVISVPNPRTSPQPPKDTIQWDPIVVSDGSAGERGLFGCALSQASVWEVLDCQSRPPVQAAHRQVDICPVEAGVAREGDGFGLFGMPIAAHLSKSVCAPKFTGKKEDWVPFVRKYEQWYRIAIGSKVLSDAQQVQLVSACLPESLQKELQLLEIEYRRSPTYTECRAKFEAMFGRARSENMRRKWMEVQIPQHAGRFNAQMFSEFRVNFKLAYADVPEASPDEARRILMDKLHPFMKRWVVDAELERQRKHPIIEFNVGVEMPLAKVRDSVHEMVGGIPSRIETRGGGVYYLHFDGEQYAELLLKFHGRSFANGRVKTQVHTVEQHLSLDEIFKEVSFQLEAQECTSEVQKRTPHSAQIRKADAHTEKKTKFDTPPASPMLPKSSGSAFKPVVHSESPQSTTVNSTVPKAAVPAVTPPLLKCSLCTTRTWQALGSLRGTSRGTRGQCRSSRCSRTRCRSSSTARTPSSSSRLSSSGPSSSGRSSSGSRIPTGMSPTPLKAKARALGKARALEKGAKARVASMLARVAMVGVARGLTTPMLLPTLRTSRIRSSSPRWGEGVLLGSSRRRSPLRPRPRAPAAPTGRAPPTPTSREANVPARGRGQLAAPKPSHLHSQGAAVISGWKWFARATTAPPSSSTTSPTLQPVTNRVRNQVPQQRGPPMAPPLVPVHAHARKRPGHTLSRTSLFLLLPFLGILWLHWSQRPQSNPRVSRATPKRRWTFFQAADLLPGALKSWDTRSSPWTLIHGVGLVS